MGKVEAISSTTDDGRDIDGYSTMASTGKVCSFVAPKHDCVYVTCVIH